MKITNKIYRSLLIAATATVAFSSCQKMSRPALGNYPSDANPPGGALNFYAAFDGTTSDPLMNGVDSIRANFPSDNPLTSVDGIRGKAIKGENKKFIKYAKPNDWATKAASFSVSFWYKGNAQTKNNTGTNGPEYIMSFKATDNYHWSGANALVFLEGSNSACAVKVMMVDVQKRDNWFTWEGGNTIAGLLDNNWHHIVLAYDAATSNMTLYKDGIANPNIRSWAGHGAINLDNSAITEFRVGSGPGTSYDTDDWLSSSWKGSIDQLRLYSKALTTTEIGALYASKM